MKFYRQRNEETLLHWAVLKSDLTAVRSLSGDQRLLRTKNALGFDPLELALFLGKKDVSALLQPENRRFVCVQKKHRCSTELLNEAEFERFFEVVYRSHLNFGSYDFFKQVIKNCPWSIRKTFWGEENRDLGLKLRKSLYMGRMEDVAIKWIDDKLGYGVFANRDLEKGVFIGEFTGKVRLLSRQKPDQNAYCFHYPSRFFSWRYYTVDALREGNETRFINHSDTPNLAPFCAFDRGLLHIVFFAQKDIQKGSQLTYNYGRDFWKHREKIDIINK